MAYLLLHGLGGDSRQPLGLVGPTLPEGSRVFAPDLRAQPGHVPVIGELLHRYPATRAEAIFRSTGLYRSLRAASRLGAAGVVDQFRKPDASARAIRLAQLPRNRAFESGEPPPSGVATTIIAAPRDPLHPLAVASLWNRILPGSTLVEVPPRDDGVDAYLVAMRAAVASAWRSSPRG